VTQRRQQLVARPLAAPAFLRAEAAVLVMLGMAFALLGAYAARRHASLERRCLGARIRVGLATEDATGVDAGVGAVETQAKAARQRADVVLGEGRVGADRARAGAGGALIDATCEHRGICDERAGMGPQDRLYAHGANSTSCAGASRAR
jgi:hypothetical protein